MKLTPLRLIKENYSSGTWSEFCEEFGAGEESVEVVIYYDSSLTEESKGYNGKS